MPSKYGFHSATHSNQQKCQFAHWQYNLAMENATFADDSSHIFGAKWNVHQLRLTAASPTQSFKYLGLIRKGSLNWSAATWAAQRGFYEQKVEAWLPFDELCGFDML